MKLTFEINDLRKWRRKRCRQST